MKKFQSLNKTINLYDPNIAKVFLPCALFAHPKEVDALAESVGAYKTDIDQKQ